MNYSREDSPCIGICSTVYGDEVCRGCKRFYKEIIDWNGYDQAKRDVVYDRIDKHIEQVMKGKITITDPKLMLSQLEKNAVRYRTDDNPYGWAYILLRDLAEHIKEPAEYGFSVDASVSQYTLPKLIHMIDDEYYALANQEFEASA